LRISLCFFVFINRRDARQRAAKPKAEAREALSKINASIGVRKTQNDG